MIYDLRFTNWFKCATVALLLSTINHQQSTIFAQGPLTPPGAPAASMKSLAQVEPRTPIASAPFTINTAGSYYLTTNLTTSVSNAIVILASGVTLDLNGFTISSTVANAAGGGSGILLGNRLRDITIFNGHIRGGVTNDGDGNYSGSGFANGIHYSGGQPPNTLVSRISVSGCLNFGINLGNGLSTVVEACNVNGIGNIGITASTVKNTVAVECGGTAIQGDQVSDCRGQSEIGSGIFASVVLNSVGTSNTGDGVRATTGQNCRGYTISGTGIDITTALNCTGTSSSGDGINAETAQNCYGTSSSGDGLNAARTANSCYGSSSTGRGLVAYNASFCTAQRANGRAIQATIATGCIAINGTNLITHKYNMP